jgi:opacity protein-like surface antigen
MKKLFLILTLAVAGMSAPAFAQDKKASAPDIQFNETNHDFGNIEEGPDYTQTFKFKNTGNAPLIINNVQTPCGCTSPGWTKEPILPGKSGEITATYHSAGRIGVFTKTLSVQSNLGEGKDQFLTIRGEVKEKGSMPAKAAEPATATPTPKGNDKATTKQPAKANKAPKKATPTN